MNRKQAVTLIQEIFDKCQQIEGKSIKLLPPKDNNALTNTYQIHIETKNDEVLVSCITNVAEKHNLAVRCKDGFCIVYKPYPNVSKST